MLSTKPQRKRQSSQTLIPGKELKKLKSQADFGETLPTWESEAQTDTSPPCTQTSSQSDPVGPCPNALSEGGPNIEVDVNEEDDQELVEMFQRFMVANRERRTVTKPNYLERSTRKRIRPKQELLSLDDTSPTALRSQNPALLSQDQGCDCLMQQLLSVEQREDMERRRSEERDG